MLTKSRKELLGLAPPRGNWVVCVFKYPKSPVYGTPYAGVLSEESLFDIAKERPFTVTIPELNLEINSRIPHWEILI